MICILGLVFSASAQTLSDETLMKIRFDQRLNAAVSPSLNFQDEQGKAVRIGDYLGQKPVLLILGYYECPMLCTLVLNGMVESAEDMRWSIGREFAVLDVSINPRENPALAASKKRAYVKRYGRAGASKDWHFLTGNQASIQQLADEVGFHYAFDPVSKQYAHPSGLVVLTPQGKVSGYLFGVTYASRDLFAALQRASASRVASPIQQLVLLCFHYNPITGKYSADVIKILRFLSALTLLALLVLVVFLVRPGRSAPDSLVAVQDAAIALDRTSAPAASKKADAVPSNAQSPPLR